MNGNARSAKIEKNASLRFMAISRCSLGKRGARRTAWEYVLNELPFFHDGHAVHQNKFNSVGILERIFESGFVDDPHGIENGDVCVGAHADAPFVFKRRCALFEALRG